MEGKERDILEQVKETLVRYAMIDRGDTVVIGVSGGVDSMILLDVLIRVKNNYDLSLVIAHVHHGLRGEEAEQDFQFVEAQAARHGLPFEGKRLARDDYQRGGNIQAKARAFRYSFYEQVSDKWRAQRIATGHHRDDHVETMLTQILRGTGGLRGILPVREGKYIRPLLEVGREEITEYGRYRGIPWREDSSNAKMTYLRNRIRGELVPWIQEEVNPSFSGPLIHFSSILREEAEYLDLIAGDAFEKAWACPPSREEVVLDRLVLEGLHPAILRRVIRKAFHRIAGSTDSLSYGHVQAMYRAIEHGDGSPQQRFDFPGGVRAFMEYREIHFCRTDLWKRVPYQYQLSMDKCLSIPEAGMILEASRVSDEAFGMVSGTGAGIALLDAKPSQMGMVVRNFRPGDRFYPLGLGGGKKVKDFFIDQKIPRSLRGRLPILEIDGKIAWVIGHRIDERFKVSSCSKNCIQVRRIWEEVEKTE